MMKGIHMKIICIGGSNVDWIATVPGDMFPQQNIFTQFKRSFGGVVHNVAQNLKSLDYNVSIMSAIGREDDGEQLLEQMKRSGIRTDMMIRSDNHPTGKIVIVNNELGRQIFHHCQTDIYEEITPQSIRQYLPLLTNYDAWVVDTDLSEETLSSIAQYKPDHLPLYAIIATHEKTLKIQPLLSKIEALFINKHEASLLTDVLPGGIDESATQVYALHKLGVKNVFLTMGEQGVYVSYQGQAKHYHAQAGQQKHTTGAGDGFASGVIDGILKDLSLDDIVDNGLNFASLIMNDDEGTYISQ